MRDYRAINDAWSWANSLQWKAAIEPMERKMASSGFGLFANLGRVIEAEDRRLNNNQKLQTVPRAAVDPRGTPVPMTAQPALPQPQALPTVLAVAARRTHAEPKRLKEKSFDLFAGELTDRAMNRFRTLHSLPNGEPHHEWVKIAEKLDEKEFKFLKNLQPKPRERTAEYNCQHPRASITTWKVAIDQRGARTWIHRIALKRLYLARNRFKQHKSRLSTLKPR